MSIADQIQAFERSEEGKRAETARKLEEARLERQALARRIETALTGIINPVLTKSAREIAEAGYPANVTKTFLEDAEMGREIEIAIGLNLLTSRSKGGSTTDTRICLSYQGDPEFQTITAYFRVRDTSRPGGSSEHLPEVSRAIPDLSAEEIESDVAKFVEMVFPAK